MFGKLLKFFIALALLPLLAAEIYTLLDLGYAAFRSGQFQSASFISLGAGFLVWTLIFIFLPRTLWLYVLGHEFTHALATMLAGGKVSAFKVSKDGGHVITDRVNWWIALSPYFVPIYAFIWICLWLMVDFYYPLRQWQPGLFFGIGFFWAFHVTFTISMMHLKQTDLSSQGYVFSFVIIPVINLIIVLLLLGLLMHDLQGTGKTFWGRTKECYVYTEDEIKNGAKWVLHSLDGQGSNR